MRQTVAMVIGGAALAFGIAGSPVVATAHDPLLQTDARGSVSTIASHDDSIVQWTGSWSGPRAGNGARDVPPADGRIVLAAATGENADPALAAAAPPSQIALAKPFFFDPAWTNPDVVEGNVIFNSTCAHCHGPNAEQAVARINLRLLQHRYGEKMDEVFQHVVSQGRPARGMPAWNGVLTDGEILKVATFLHTVQQEK